MIWGASRGAAPNITKGLHIKLSKYLVSETAGKQQDIVKDHGHDTRAGQRLQT